MISAHPPGGGTGSAVRGAGSLAALRTIFRRVDVVALAFDGEAAFADPAARLIARPGRPPAARRLAMLVHGGAYYADEQGARVAERLRALTRDGELLERYDLVWCHALLLARAAHDVPAGARVLDIDNVPSADLRTLAGGGAAQRAYRRALGAAFAHEEGSRAGLFDVVTVTTPAERWRLGAVRPPVVVLPNTVPEVPAAPVAATAPLVLFVGSLRYGPNVDAVRWLAEAIVPRLRELVPAAQVRVVGRGPGEDVRGWCAAAGIELVADAPSLQPHHHEARAVIAPLRSGGGTRIKILEALAYGVPVVATPEALAGLRLGCADGVAVAPDAAGLAGALARLLGAAAEAARMGAAGRAAWARDHGPAGTHAIVARIVADLIPP
ncbi:MAG TPA: glycosyltransferase [Solirubrobacteraceae bacterium]